MGNLIHVDYTFEVRGGNVSEVEKKAVAEATQFFGASEFHVTLDVQRVVSSIPLYDAKVRAWRGSE